VELPNAGDVIPSPSPAMVVRGSGWAVGEVLAGTATADERGPVGAARKLLRCVISTAKAGRATGQVVGHSVDGGGQLLIVQGPRVSVPSMVDRAIGLAPRRPIMADPAG
jgi:hypothetical protein